MPIGSRKNRGGGDYVFVNGKAVRADEVANAAPTAPSESSVPGQEEAASVPGAAEASGEKKPRKKWSAKRSLQQMETSGAFDLNEDFAISLERAVNLNAEERRKNRRATFVMGGILLVLIAASLCISINEVGKFYDPATVVAALATRVKLAVGQLFSLPYYTALSAQEANAAIPGYADIASRFDTTVVTVVCGFLLALAGMMYQNVFKNPIASPTMLGVNAGVRIGTIILVILFGEAATYMEGARYALCYVGGIIIILLVIGASKLMAGKGRQINVVDMLIVGSVIAQFLQVVTTFFLTYVLDDDAYEIFYELTSGMRTDTEWTAFVFLAIVVVISVVPVFMMRFRLNVVAFDDSDAKMLGVDPQRTRVVVLVLGTIMILAAQIHVGVISMVALVVPFLVRYIVGSEFGKQMVGNMILGPMLLLVCRDVCSMIEFVGGGLSLEMVVGIVALPLYIWMMALGKRGWE